MSILVSIAVVTVPLWGASMAVLLTPKTFYTNTWDKLTRGKYRKDRNSLQMMLDHIRSFPEEWSISDGVASFPKQGSKQIYIQYTGKNMTYDMPSIGGGAQPLLGHYAAQFHESIAKELEDRRLKTLARQLFPNVNEGTLQLR